MGFCYKERVSARSASDSSPQRDGPAYPIGSVDKALRLLLLVAERPQGLRTGDASAILGVAPSTAHRLLQMLGHHGFVEQDVTTRRYQPGPTLERLRRSRGRVLELARPLLDALVVTTQETVHLASLESGEALTILSVESPHLLRVGDRSGHSQPAQLSAMGTVLLAALDDHAVEQQLPELTGVERVALAERLKVVRAQGYAAQDGEVESGVSALAVPVGGVDEGTGLAIGITYPTGRISTERFDEALTAAQRTAVALSTALSG